MCTLDSVTALLNATSVIIALVSVIVGLIAVVIILAFVNRGLGARYARLAANFEALDRRTRGPTPPPHKG